MAKVLAIGDIHCKQWVIDRVAELLPNYDTVIFVGDYVDDFFASAADSINTLVKLKKLQDENPDKVVLLTGNHDYGYAFETSRWSGYDPITDIKLHNDHKNILTWLRNLPVYTEIDGIVYSHAGLSDRWKDGDELWQDNSPIWIRPGKAVSYMPKRQVFGHTPSQTCWEVERNVWCIDTFSTYADGSQYGDGTVLEVTDGKLFNKIKL